MFSGFLARPPPTRVSPDRRVGAAVRTGLAEAPVRVRALPLGDGRRVWLKRVEALSFRLWLVKGNPARAFEKDRRGLHLLAGAGLPVAPILAEGADYFVTSDVGPTLRDLLEDSTLPPRRLHIAFAAAGHALAQLHARGYAHGRPSIRDICWDGTTARFIDLERFSRRRSLPQDVLLLVHSVLTLRPDATGSMDAALAGYIATAPPHVWPRAVTLARRLRPLVPVAERLSALRPQSHDLRGFPATIRWILAHEARGDPAHSRRS